MKRIARWLVPIVAAACVGACAAAGNAETQASTTPEQRSQTPPAGSVEPSPLRADVTPASTGPSSEPITFASSRYGYGLVLPGDWTATETPGSGGTHPDEPGVDTFRDRTGRTLSVVGERAAALAGWTCAINRHLQGDEHRLTAESSTPINVAGVPGRVSEYHLEIRPYVIHYLTIETVRDGLGLTLSLESTTNRDDEDRAILDGLMETFSWT